MNSIAMQIAGTGLILLALVPIFGFLKLTSGALAKWPNAGYQYGMTGVGIILFALLAALLILAGVALFAATNTADPVATANQWSPTPQITAADIFSRGTP